MPQVLVPNNLPSDTILLSRQKWDSVRAHLDRQQREEEARQRARTAALQRQTTSRHLKDDWPNTLAKLHAKRLQERQDRLQKKEQDQLKIDAEEADIQATIRSQKLAAAREMLFHNEERVRNLDGALLLSEVLKERDEQLALKARLQAEEAERERQWQLHQRWDWKEQERQDREESRARHAALVRSNEKEKADGIRMKEETKRQELEEAHQIRLATEQYKQQVQADKEQEFKTAQAHKAAAMEAARTQRTFELLKQTRNQEENAEIRVFGLAKLEMARQMAVRRREVLDKVRQRSEVACARLQAQRSAAAADEDARIAAVVAQKLAQRDAAAAEEAAARAAVTMAIAKHRAAERQRNRDDQLAAAEAKLSERRSQDETTRQHAAELAQRHRELQQQQEQNRDHWHQQREEVETKRLVEKEEDYEDVRKLKCVVQNEKMKFREYVDTEMKRLTELGRNTYPLKVASMGEAPGFLRQSTEWSGVGIRPF